MKDELIVEKIRAKTIDNSRYGYRRIHNLLERDGHQIGIKQFRRIWKQYGFSLSRKRPRKKIGPRQERRPKALGANDVWAYDFVHDRCANKQVLKCLTIVDEYTRECLSILVDGRISSTKVIEELARIMTVRGTPNYLRSDNGPEFIAKAVRKWLSDEHVNTAYIEPGKPWQNGVDESFNGKFRDECLNMEWFTNRAQAKIQIEMFRQHYNDERPHSSLNYLTPTEFARRLEEKGEGHSGDAEAAPANAT